MADAEDSVKCTVCGIRLILLRNRIVANERQVFIMSKVIRVVLAFIIMFTAVMPAAYAEENGDYKLLALTFDDGPSAHTERLLNTLAEKNAHCTFFIVGTGAARYPQLLERMVNEGHQIANHTYDHPYLSASNVDWELAGCREYLVNAGGEQTYYVRPPYGSADNAVLARLNAPAILWSVDPYDWKYRNSATVTENVVSSAKDGDIILLHDIHSTSVDAVPAILDQLQARGFEFVTVSELFRRRGVTPVNGQKYYYARNNGINLGPYDPEDFDESKLDQHWAYSAIQYVIEHGLFSGNSDGKFKPDKKITRAMFLTVLGRLSGDEMPQVSEAIYADVPEDYYYAPYIAWAVEKGIAYDYVDDENRFNPDDPITREQMALAVMRFLDYKGYSAGVTAPDNIVFTDSSDLSYYAEDAVRRCVYLGLMNGDTDGTFRPLSYATRAEAAVLFMRVHKYIADK